MINRGGKERLHIWMCQLPDRFHPDEASLLSRSRQIFIYLLV
jgi:hypothetical protein